MEVRGKKIHGDLLLPEIFEIIKNNPKLNLKQLNSVYKLAQEQGIKIPNNCDLVGLSVNLGMLEPKETVIEMGKYKAGKPIMSVVNDVYTFMQGIIKSGQIELNFEDFKYVGSGSWAGDWHIEQYEILNVEDKHV